MNFNPSEKYRNTMVGSLSSSKEFLIEDMKRIIPEGYRHLVGFGEDEEGAWWEFPSEGIGMSTLKKFKNKEDSGCWECRYWYKIEDRDGAECGECRVHAPLRSESGAGVFPETSVGEWCGEWKQLLDKQKEYERR